MTTDTAPTTTDRGRWGEEVVETRQLTYRWGSHAFRAEFQLHADGEGHVLVAAPPEPPAAAEEIVADALDAGGEAAMIAVALAEGWGVDGDEA